MNHLQGHRTPDRVYYRNILEANALLGATLFRPPHGWMRPRQARLIDKRFGIVMFDVVTRDYSKRMTPEQVLGNVKKYSRPGSIIVFHDSQRGERNLKGALAPSIEWLKMQGYRFDVLSNLKHSEK